MTAMLKTGIPLGNLRRQEDPDGFAALSLQPLRRIDGARLR